MLVTHEDASNRAGGAQHASEVLLDAHTVIGMDEVERAPPQHLLGRPSQRKCRARTPELVTPLGVDHEDQLRRLLDQRPEAFVASLEVLPGILADVREEAVFSLRDEALDGVPDREVQPSVEASKTGDALRNLFTPDSFVQRGLHAEQDTQDGRPQHPELVNELGELI